MADLDAAAARHRSALETLAEHDRPFRRRGHDAEIHNAHRTAEKLPDQITTHAGNVDAITAHMDDIDRRITRAEALDQRRPAMEAQLADVDDRLCDDRRIRSRAVRREQPQHVVDTLGRRPLAGDPARAWDVAAGQLDQHQTAYGISTGLDPSRGQALPAGYLHSRNLANDAAHQVAHTLSREQQLTPSIKGPALGIEL